MTFWDGLREINRELRACNRRYYDGLVGDGMNRLAAAVLVGGVWLAFLVGAYALYLWEFIRPTGRQQEASE